MHCAREVRNRVMHALPQYCHTSERSAVDVNKSIRFGREDGSINFDTTLFRWNFLAFVCFYRDFIVSSVSLRSQRRFLVRYVLFHVRFVYLHLYHWNRSRAGSYNVSIENRNQREVATHVES